jgi:hypothetical protein
LRRIPLAQGLDENCARYLFCQVPIVERRPVGYRSVRIQLGCYHQRVICPPACWPSFKRDNHV